MWSATNEQINQMINPISVLILLFLECGLRPRPILRSTQRSTVLILLFLECGLRHDNDSHDDEKSSCLNPTFSGMWSATIIILKMKLEVGLS